MMPIQASVMSVNKASRIPVQAWVETFKSYIAHLMVVKRILYLKQEGFKKIQPLSQILSKRGPNFHFLTMKIFFIFQVKILRMFWW